MLLQLHEMHQVVPKSQQEVLELAKARREAERRESIHFLAKWGAIVVTVGILALIAPTRSAISLILYAAAMAVAVYAMFVSPNNFNLKPVVDIGEGDILPEHEPASSEQVVKLIKAAKGDKRIDAVLRPWLESGHPIRMEQFEVVQRFTAVSTKASTEKESRDALERERAAYMQPAPEVARENDALDDIARPVSEAAAAALLTSQDTSSSHRHDDASAHTPGYGLVPITDVNMAYAEGHAATDGGTTSPSLWRH